jgi:hypothetical protein
MKRIAKALLYTATLFVFNHRIAASESSNMVTISVQIFPPQAQAGPVSNNWTIELQFIKKTIVEEPNGSTTIINEQIIGRKGGAADNEGKTGWIVPVQKYKGPSKHEQIRLYYKVVCYGGWAYNDGSSKELDAEIPGVHDVTIYMKRK